MNAISSVSPALPKPPKSEAYAKARSSCVDSFARLEYSIISICPRLDITMANRALVGQRLKKLREAATLEKLPKAERTSLTPLLDRAEELLQHRTDIVHSEMVVASTSSETMAIFHNAANRAAGNADARIYSLTMLRNLASDANELATQISGVGLKIRQPRPETGTINPASSPPPPSPDAAGGP